MSFFQPTTTEGKAKKPEKEIPSSIREKEPPPKVALKERNRAVPESDSPVKRPGRKVAQVLSSEGEDEDEAPGTPKSKSLCQTPNRALLPALTPVLRTAAPPWTSPHQDSQSAELHGSSSQNGQFKTLLRSTMKTKTKQLRKEKRRYTDPNRKPHRG